ncbi:hypothetical protein H7J51_05350 [Mycobacterium crocinum]|uniref:DUF3987 domain-containing protein n=1 Tax=Mycolicibacterium crocinum TaxID=388459 RepID=A0ABY3TNC2_9MYCO|nr:hypothetical protein [Mycolicibacterium crocinum]MCV7214710.1 hypothetical protein [Mycolicibacterium crocinum]ULN41603.1 hypothetical protein MI149_00090 [Mycolicibacterium crocinum]
MSGNDDFFDATPELATIRQWAHARFAAKWAVFLAVLLRVHASTSPGVQLPGVIGGPASLNLIGAFVSPSGGGKGISDKVARLAWPAPIIERPIGSGEGIAALFAPPKKEGAERITQAIINVSEIDSLAGIASRQGSILLAQLKAAVMGELIGQSNASEATTRIVLPHSYRMCMSIGAQPGHCDVIFNDTTGGTPQRVLWVPTTDPNMPSDPPADPAPLNIALPAWSRTTDTVEITYGPSTIRQQIIGAHLARQRGEADALDGHRMLTKCKVAAGLALMHHRSVISDLDWQLSEAVMAVSDTTREWILEEARKTARAKVRDRAMARAAGEEFYDSSRLETVKRSLLRMLERDGEQAGGDLRRRLGKREKRELFDQAIDLLENSGLVASVPGPHNSVRYRIGSPVTTGVTPQKTRSDGVTTEVTRDQSASVTDLDTRRSAENDVQKLSCQQWFNQYIAELQASGHTTVTSFAAVEAGIAAGYRKGNVRAAMSNHPDVHTIDRKGGCATWSIEPGKRPPTYQSAASWLDEFIDRQTTATINPEEAKAAGMAAGHPWHSVRRAAGISPRIESVPAVGDARNNRFWRITNAAPSKEDAS